MNKKTIDRKELIEVRSYTANDRNFILATYLRGLYYGDSWFSMIPKGIFMENQHRVIEKVLSNPNVDIKVACLKEDKDTILGYSISRKLGDPQNPIVVLDWIFCKSAWRGIGIAKMLYPAHTSACTHLTKSGAAIVREKCNHLIFNPYIFG